MRIPVIEQAKIQAQVLVPLVKALQAELGEERANELVRKALGDIYRRPRRTVVAGKTIESPGANHDIGICVIRRGQRPRVQCPSAIRKFL